MIIPLFGAIVAAAVFVDREHQDAYGYGESTLSRIPDHLKNNNLMGVRGEPRSWRDSDPRFSGAGFKVSGGLLGMRGPTSSFRYPLPRPWEENQVGWMNAIPARTNRY